jgi:peptidoglycan/xylan/chitin deacetylase (PgdA/CDA1 family)
MRRQRRGQSNRQRPRLLALAIVGCGLLVIVSLAGLVRSLQAWRAETTAASEPLDAGSPVVAKSSRSAAPTAAPVPVAISSVHVPILMYHHLEALSAEHADDPDYQQLFVAPKAFEEQVAYLQENGYHTITFAELVGAFAGEVTLPDKPVIITFDDGWDDIYNVAYPILKDHGMRATFFIPTNWVENLDGVVSWAQIEEMSAGGMEFGSHSVTHPYLTTADPEWRKYEIEASKAALEEHTGKTVTAFAYPFGLYDDTVIADVKAAGYLAACTIDPGATATASNLLTLPRTWVYDWTTIDQFAGLLTAS